MKAVVAVLAVLAWPCAARRQECEAADTVVAAGELVTVANLAPLGTWLEGDTWLQPEPGFQGIIVNISTSSGTNVVLWALAHQHCFPHDTDWWRVGVASGYTDSDNTLWYNMFAGECHWYCDTTQFSGQPVSSRLVAAGPSRWRVTDPPNTCTNTEVVSVKILSHESLSPPSINLTPTTTAASTTTTTTGTSTTTTTTTAASTTTTTTAASTTTTTTGTSTTTTTTTSSGTPVVVIGTVAMVAATLVVVVVVVVKIRHDRIAAAAAGAAVTPPAQPGTPKHRGTITSPPCPQQSQGHPRVKVRKPSTMMWPAPV